MFLYASYLYEFKKKLENQKKIKNFKSLLLLNTYNIA